MPRALALSALIAAAIAAMWIELPAQSPAAQDLPALTYVATANQLGVVGYRDPAGVISPDGTRLAYAEGRVVRVVPVGGGAPVTVATANGQVRHIAWQGDADILVEDATADGRWWRHRIGQNGRVAAWPREVGDPLRQVAWNHDGSLAAAIANTSAGPQLVRLAAGTEPLRTSLNGRAEWPAFRAGGEIACVINRRVSLPCGAEPIRLDPDRDVHGPIAFSPDGDTLYFAAATDAGMVALTAADLPARRTRRLSNVSRDAYAPSVSAGGTVVFKTQTYRTHLADVAFTGGQTRQLTTFQSETPSYHPTRPLIAFTFGSWRRVVDDAKYPDIAQEIGTIDVSQSLPFATPAQVLEDSESEDQAMTWSPNGKWIAFHTHKEMSDDVWLRPADAVAKAADKRITFLGRGAEVGWPRWSPDGRTVLLNGARQRDGQSVLYAVGVNQDTGDVSSEVREIAVEGITGEMGHAEWMPDSARVIAIAREGPGRHVIFTVPAAGGRATIVHRVDSEHDFPGLGVSTDGRHVAFIAPAHDGFFQVFVKAIGGRTPPVQVTIDPSHKTQPAFSPDNARIAFTVWSYQAAFWSFKDR